MENRNDFGITSKQLVFLMVGAMLGTGILSLPRTAVKAANQDAWIVVILGALFPLVSICFTSLVYKKYPGKDFIETTRLLAGKYAGTVIIFIFSLYCLITATVLLRAFIDIITAFLLPRTPLPVKLALMLCVCAYMAANSIKILGRAFEFLFYLLLPVLLLVLPALIEHGSVQCIMPVFSGSIQEYIKGTFTTGFAYSGFELFLIYCPFVVRKNNALRGALTGLLLTLGTYLLLVLATIMVFGPEFVIKFIWPVLRLIATAEFPVAERLEFIFIMAWVGVAFRPIASQYFSSSYLMSRVFGLKSHKPVVLMFFPVIILLAMLPKDVYATFKLSDYVGGLSIGIGVLLPILLYVLSMFRREKGRSSNAKA